MMRSTVGQLAYWLLPQGMINALKLYRRSTSQRLNQTQRLVLQANEIWRDRHRNQRCFILATGPSIKQQDLSGLSNEICIAVSNFYLHPDFPVIRPAYYCLAPWHPPHDPKHYEKLVNRVLEASGSAHVYLGLSDADKTSGVSQEDRSRLSYLNLSLSVTEMRQQQIDLTKNLLVPQSVTIMALQLALYMGFGEIYLLGVDHDAILNTTGKFANTHFYEENKAILKTDVGYFKDELASYLSLWSQYECIQRFAQAQGAQIFNATPSSLLDVFERKSLSSVLDVMVKS